MSPPAHAGRSSSPPRSSSPDPLDPQQQKEARLKRRIAELELQVASQATPSQARAAKSYVTLGRPIRKVVSLFDPIEALVGEYDRRQELEEKREEEGDNTPITYTDEQQRLYHSFEELRKFVPAIKPALLKMEPTELTAICKAEPPGRSATTLTLSGAAMVDFVNFPGAKDPLVASSRDNRGAEGEVTGPLIFPVDYDYTDPVVREKVINGDPKYKITANQWPLGVYQNSVYDPRNRGKGLFKSMSLLQTHMHLFTAPASAKKLKDQVDKERQAANGSDAENVRPSDNNERPHKKRRVTAPATSKKCVANKIAMRHVTPRSIAYAAVHHRFALSDAPSWNEVDGDFDYVLYYNNILDWFQNAPGPVAQKEVDDLLVWWDQRVFKNGGRAVEEPAQGSSSSILTMRQERAARELA
ncbi:hypothetical protein MVEN_00108100 [Mycena venus]|uniref:Uncharacterized protein n=1 Tax=Mycena venus TaxID=2733690 RepID=A0A8H6Z4L3_9AGAR|nr:hypothetical protein MVEN_00108100 [Mycena venus]